LFALTIWIKEMKTHRTALWEGNHTDENRTERDSREPVNGSFLIRPERRKNMGELKLINLADVQIEEIEWLWKPYIPKGKVTLVRGMPGEGKTMVLSSLVAALTNGDPLFNEEKRHEPISCIYQSAEDGLGDTIKPRLESGDVVQCKVWAINEEQDPLSFTDARIEEAIRNTGAGLMILNPLQAYLGANVDMYRPNEVRPVMTNLVNIAHRTGCAIVLVEHMNKVKDASAIIRGLGSMDITGAARSVLMIGKANDHSEEVYLAHVKSNLAPKGPTLSSRSRISAHSVKERASFPPISCSDVKTFRHISKRNRERSKTHCSAFSQMWTKSSASRSTTSSEATESASAR